LLRVSPWKSRSPLRPGDGAEPPGLDATLTIEAFFRDARNPS
jgi:hypothetical protein